MRRTDQVYDRRDILRMLAACTAGPTGHRNRALLVLLWRGGLRCGEALALRAHHVDVRRCTVRIERGKGDRSRTVALDADAIVMLERWRAIRSGLGLAHRGRPLICTLKGRPLMSCYVRELVSRLARAANVPYRVHPHGFRHTHAVELAREGVPLPVIRQQLGHSNVAITDAYLRRLSPAEIEGLALKRKGWAGDKV